MKKMLKLVIAAIVVMTTLMLQGCQNNEANAAEERIANANERIADAEERSASANERMADAMESMVPRSITDRESGSTIGWAALSLSEREEILNAVGVGTTHHYGDPVRPNPPIQQICFIIYLVDVPSQTENQTLLEYSYTDSRGVSGKNWILVQGHLETPTGGFVPVESIPYVLNANECCYHYGGCINGTSCDQQRPHVDECSPCDSKPKEPCQPCKEKNGVVKTHDGDGELNTPSSSRRIPPRRK